MLCRGIRGRPGVLRRFLRNSLTSPGDLCRLAYRFYIKRRSGTPRHGPIYIGVQSKVAPNLNSRITLSKARDRLGTRKLKLDWRIGESENLSAERFTNTLGPVSVSPKGSDLARSI